MIAGELSESEHADGVGWVGSNDDGVLRVGQSFRGLAGAHQGGSVVDQQGGVIRLEVERGFVMVLGLREVAMIGFVLTGEEVGGGSAFGIGGFGEAGEGIGINLAVADDFFGY